MKIPPPSEKPPQPEKQPRSKAKGDKPPQAVANSRRALLRVLEHQWETEHQLRRSEALLNETQALARVGGWEYDVDSGRVRWTDGMFGVYGLSCDYDPGNAQQNIELFPPSERARLAAAFQRALKEGEPYDLELQFVTADGRKLWIRTIGQAQREEGRVVRVFGNIVDITERKRVERELQHKTELAQLLEQLARAASEAVSPEAAMQICLSRICENGKWALGRVATFGTANPRFRPTRSQWFCTEPARFDAFMRYSEGYEHQPSLRRFIGLVLHDKRAIWLPDLTALDNPRSGRLVKVVEAGLKGAFAFPVIVRGEVVAVLEFFAAETREPDALLIEGTGGLASQFARMIERSAADEARARLAAIVENSSDAITGRAIDGTITSWNAAAERILGYAAAEAIGCKLIEIQPPELRELAAKRRQLVLAGRPVRNAETVRVAKDGRRLDVTLSVSPIRDGSGNIIGTATIMRDITARKRAEQALHDYAGRLQGLSRRLVATEETERRKINRELHDRVGQNLAAINIQLNIIRSKLSQHSLCAVHSHLRTTQALLEETAAHARNVMADLRPPALDDYGLLAALRSYVESFVANAVVPVTVQGDDLALRLPLAAEISLFRIAQGAIANAVQHARATRIAVTLAATPERVTLTIADDGAGFDPEHVVTARPSWGLTIMQERAEAIGARLTVESAPGKGTRVCVEIDRPG